MPLWETALWGCLGALLLEAYEVKTVISRAHRLPWRELGGFYVLAVTLRCVNSALISLIMSWSIQGTSAVLSVFIGAMTPLLLARLAQGSGRTPHLSEHPRSDSVDSEMSRESHINGTSSLARSFRYALQGARALLIVTGITVAVSPPTQAVDLSPGTQVVATFVVRENKLTIKHGQQEIKVSRTRLVAGETKSYPAGAVAPTPKPSTSRATRDSSRDEHREHRGGVSLFFDFTAGLARIFDPLGSLPPPSAAAAPSFIQSVLGKGYELATIHGYQDAVKTSPPTSTGSDGAGSSS